MQKSHQKKSRKHNHGTATGQKLNHDVDQPLKKSVVEIQKISRSLF